MSVGGAAVTVTGGDALDGTSIQAPTKSAAPAMPVSISCAAAPIIPTGYVALSAPVTFGPEGFATPERLFEVKLRFRPALMPKGARYNSVQIFVKRKVPTPVFAAPLPNMVFDEENGIVSFRAAELATYQVAVRAEAGTAHMRRYTNRAIVGISMGGGGSAQIGLRNADKFDVIGPLVPELGLDLHYALRMISDFRFGGFCTAEDEAASGGTLKVGMDCDPIRNRKPQLDQFETVGTWDRMLYQKGEGVGLTLDRSLYMKASRDLSRAFGNPALWNKDDPYLPPGVPVSYIQKSIDERCGASAQPIVLKNFFDKRFNPDGSKDVITFCDGGDSSANMGLGIFDPAVTQDDPAEPYLAVDVNGNKKRDQGEPVLFQVGEEWDDFGTDKLPSKMEAGYDATSNPDPAGDDWHYLKNPLGKEGNWRWDEGEMFFDTGTDGLMGKGCEQGMGAECYDHGEGDGKWTLTPNMERWIAHSAKELWEKLTPAQRARLDLYIDAGIRDFLNAAIAANSFFGSVVANGEAGRIYDEFRPMTTDKNKPTTDIDNFDFGKLGKHVYVRYGNPDATEFEQERGDGRHVGTATQVVNRVIALFTFIASRYPQGDRDTYGTSASNFKRDLTFTAASGRQTPYAVFLPPGYEEAENATKRYPVVYFFHGYGMQPADLIDLSSIFSNFMISPQIPKEKRFPKFIIVYVDGLCRPGGRVPLTGGDMCERGTFYTNAAGNTTAKMEDGFLELMADIDRTYRTKGEEMIPVVD